VTLDRFRRTLDRLGSDALGRRIEAGIRMSRPTVGPDQARAVVSRAVIEVAHREMQPTFARSLRVALIDPWTRAAFAVSLTAIGFAVGTAIGAPDLARTRDLNDGPLITATADDASF
jgi:hypothetical protein